MNCSVFSTSKSARNGNVSFAESLVPEHEVALPGFPHKSSDHTWLNFVSVPGSLARWRVEFSWKSLWVLHQAVGALWARFSCSSFVCTGKLCVEQAQLLEWKSLKYRSLTVHVKTSSNNTRLEREASGNDYVSLISTSLLCLGRGVGAQRQGVNVWWGTLFVLPW